MVKLYVEGGGDSKTIRTACRAGFSQFLSKAGLKGRMPRIVACGSRGNAYDSFRTAINSGEKALLLVDSESSIEAEYQRGEPEQWQPWSHLRQRWGDQWKKPAKADEKDCHLMVQCMEAWFLGDRESLKSFFGQEFNANPLPAIGKSIESIDKEQIYRSLTDASRSCKTKGK